MAEQETIVDIIAWLRKPREGENAYLTLWRDEIADRIEAAHKRKVDALKQRCAELNAEVAAKDAVIKRLNDAISEEQGRKMATAEKSSVVDTKFELCHYPEQVLKIGRDFQNKDGFRGAHYDTVKLLCDTIEYQQEQLKAKTEVGDAAKLREAVVLALSLLDLEEGVTSKTVSQKDIDFMKAALAAPPRNCDVGTTEEQLVQYTKFCYAHRSSEKGCGECPLCGEPCCELAWAQMPYESEATDGE